MVHRSVIPAGEWLRVREEVLPFVDPDEGEPYGNVLLVCQGGRRRWIGADSQRLVVLDAEATAEDAEVLLPPRLVNAAVALADSPEEEIALEVRAAAPGGRPAVTLVAGQGRVELPGGSGVFPDWRALIARAESRWTAHVTVDRSVTRRMTEEARRAPGDIDLDRCCPSFWLHADVGGLRMTVVWPRHGRSTFSLPGEATGSASLAVSPRSLAELLHAESGDEVSLKFPADPSTPLGLEGENGWRAYLLSTDTSEEALRPHVEALLRSVCHGEAVARDEDGDYPLPSWPAPLYARLVAGEPHRLLLFTIALDGVERSEQLLAELNEQNAGLSFARAVWAAGRVFFEVDLDATQLEEDAVTGACTRLSELAATLGPVLSMAFGGLATGR